MNKKLYKVCAYLMLPLLLINITTSEIGWELFGINFGRSLYWVLIGIAGYIAYHSPYRRLVIWSLLVGILLRILELSGEEKQIELLRKTALAIVFVVAGAVVYGKNSSFLHKQLIYFLALCIPIMLFQILGISSFFFGWVTDYLHNPDLMTADEIGKFIKIPLYPTLFVGRDQLFYQIGQGRPAGLLYANNILSIFVSFTGALNMAVTKRVRLNISDVIVIVAVVLAMSKVAYVITFLLCIISLIFDIPGKRLWSLKFLGLLAVSYLLYYLFFPGLFIASFSHAMIYGSILPRLTDLSYLLGFEEYVDRLLFHEKILIGFVRKEDAIYSGVSILLHSKAAIPVLFLMAAMAVLYIKNVNRMRKISDLSVMPYIVILIACILTQFGTAYFSAPSYQFIAGLALFPVFKRIWQFSPASNLVQG